MSLPAVPIDDLVEPVRTWNPASAPDETFNYIDLSAVDQGKKQIKIATSISGSDAPSRARQLVREGDILVSTVRPNLNGVAAVTEEFDGATASTGFCVLRPHNGNLASNYLMHWVRSPAFVNLMVREATGASYPAVSDRIVKSSKIPLPPLPEQRRIAAILDKADALRRKRSQAIELLDSLTQSIFLEMFGETLDLPGVPLGKALSHPLRNGLSPAKSGSIKARVLTLSAITGKVFKAGASKEAAFAIEPPANQRVVEGQFLICRGNGNKALVGIGVRAPFSMPDMTFPDTIIAGRVDDHWFDSRYFEHVWNSPIVRRQIEQSARTTNGTFKVNQQVLERIEIPRPDQRLQREFGKRIASIHTQMVRCQDQLVGQETLFASLQSRAFSGQL